MGAHDDIRIGKLPPIATSEPMPDATPPEGHHWARSAITGHWHLFRDMTGEECIYLGRQRPLPADEPDPRVRQIIEEEGARPTSLIAVHKPGERDPLHDLQLLWDLKVINERTVRELGPLPQGALCRPTKPKAERLYWEASRPVNEDASNRVDAAVEEETAMNLRSTSMALAMATTINCTLVDQVLAATQLSSPESAPAPSLTVDDPLGFTKKEVSGIDGIADILEAYIYAPQEVRLKYMADEVEVRRLSHPDQVLERIPRDRYEFKIGIDYNMMVLFGTGELLDIKLNQKDNVIRVDFVPVERDEDYQVLRKLGPPGAYVFEYRKGRWTLTQELR